MRRRQTTLLAVVIAGLTSMVVLPLGAQEEPLPISVELLTARDGGTFTDDVSMQFRVKLEGKSPTKALNSHDPSQMIVARITVQPGAQFPWHTHSGPVLVNVVQGELIYVQASDCVGRSYPAGAAFVDPGRGNVHTAYNPTDGETVLVAVFFEVPPTGPLTIPVDDPEGCEVAATTASHH